jgi:nucleotidyltransferase/DNA polymerase involved in DNA repair
MNATTVSREIQGAALPEGGSCNDASPSTFSTPLRATSKRRIARLQTIIAELKVRDLGCAGTAALVDCSQSAARLYLAELREAGVICSRTIRQAAGNEDKFAHRLHSDQQLIERFLAKLGDSMQSDAVSVCVSCRHVSASAQVRHFHIIRDDDKTSHKVSNSLPQPDPLICALFGRSSGY